VHCSLWPRVGQRTVAIDDAALTRLVEGNARYVSGKMNERDFSMVEIRMSDPSNRNVCQQIARRRPVCGFSHVRAAVLAT
jgi:hypothetical protein